MYRTCEEYVLATLDALKQELNKSQSRNIFLEKQLSLDKEMIDQKNEDLKNLVELLNSLKFKFAGKKIIIDNKEITIDDNLFKYLSENYRRLCLKVI